jgi:hypothetical protein
MRTLEEAHAAGYRERKDWEYGGEEITVKGELLVKGAKEAISETAWRKHGMRIKRGPQPHATCFGRVGSLRRSQQANLVNATPRGVNPSLSRSSGI